MNAIDNKARVFDQCGQFNPFLNEYDLDSSRDRLELGYIFHRETKGGKFEFSQRSHFRFFVDDHPSLDVSCEADRPVLVSIDSAAILEAVQQGNNVIELCETVRLWRGLQPVSAEICASVKVFRSGPPRPLIDVIFVPQIDLADGTPADGHLVLGTVLLKPDRFTSVECRGSAQFLATVNARLGEGEQFSASTRRHRQGDDERDRGWLKATETVTDWLEFNPAEVSFTLNQLDFAVPYQYLRQLLQSVGSSHRGESTLAVTVKTEMRTPDGVATTLKEQAATIHILGALTESIVFSGLGESRRLLLAQKPAERSLYGFPPVRARLNSRNSSPAVVEAIELSIESETAHLNVEVKTTLRAGVLKYTDTLASQALAPGEPAVSFPIPLERLVAMALASGSIRGELAVDVHVQVHRQSPLQDNITHNFDFTSTIEFEDDPPQWICCIDFGTSSTAIWIGKNSTLAQGHQLRLGDWLSAIDPTHSESVLWMGQDKSSSKSDQQRQSVSYLLPSQIGLSADINLRADFDPLSLGDLRATYPGIEGAKRRLEMLGRSYDVSVPFPSSSLAASNSGAIVTGPKKRMILRANHCVMGLDVVEQSSNGNFSMVRRVDLAKLVEDCFDELGQYIAITTLELDIATSPNLFVDEIAQARLDPSARFGVVVTHPSGIDQTRREIYRRAGERFLRGFCRGGEIRRGDVRLAAEALAAARFGIEDYVDQNPGAASVVKNFVTLDIGAGTYDVTVIRRGVGGASNWEVLSHFGLAIGGMDLDRELVSRVAGILQQAAKLRVVVDNFEIDQTFFAERLAGDTARMHSARARFRMELQAAKTRLTYALLDSSDDGYLWPSKAAGGTPLDIKIGEPGADAPAGDGEKGQWAFRPKRPNNMESFEVRPGAEIVFERSAAGEASVRLRIWRDAFDGMKTENDAVTLLTEVMGGELPRLALGDAEKSAAAPVVIVTGRAALWPPLYELIEHTVSQSSAGAQMARRKPFPPMTMKHAVVRGAVSLAPEISDMESAIDNPIAVVTFKVDVKAIDGGGASRAIDNVTLLVDTDEADGQRRVTTSGPFVIARIIPGLDRAKGREERMRLFRDLYKVSGVRPFVELTHELNYPVPSPRGPVTWTVKWKRDLSGLRLTFDCGVEPVIEFGPFGGGRVYGPQ